MLTGDELLPDEDVAIVVVIAPQDVGEGLLILAGDGGLMPPVSSQSCILAT
jgi:hypothetical protein